jgi:hypothetical protein
MDEMILNITIGVMAGIVLAAIAMALGSRW